MHPSGTSWLNYGNGGSSMSQEDMAEAIRFCMQHYNVVRMTSVPGNSTVRPAIDGTTANHGSAFLKYTFPNPGSCNRLFYAIGGAGHQLQWHKDIIDLSIQGNGLASFYLHDISDTGDMNEAHFEAFLDYAIEQSCEFVTMKDLQPWNDKPCIKGDLDGNGKVDFNDLAIVANNRLKEQ